VAGTEADGSEDDDDDESITGGPVHELRPHFDNPHFGPFDEEPLDLGSDQSGQGCVKYEVPASITRYLPDFQVHGIRFMYDKCINGNGCILGYVLAIE
jgi:hypothetical protein